MYYTVIIEHNFLDVRGKTQKEVLQLPSKFLFSFSSFLLGALLRKRLKESVGPQIGKAYKEEIN